MENTISAGGGMRFYPTDEELIRLYLLPKVAGLHLPLDGYVLEGDLYGRPPWEIFEECSSSAARNGDSKERVKYFFTKLKKRSKKRFNRHIGDFSTWHGSDNADPIFHDKCDISRVRGFSYKNKGNSEYNGKFLMKEYSLSDSMRLSIKKLFHNHKVDEEFVLCRIKRKKEKKDPSRDDIGLRNANREDDQHQIYEEMVLNLLNQSGSQGGGVVSHLFHATSSTTPLRQTNSSSSKTQKYLCKHMKESIIILLFQQYPLEGAPQFSASQEQQEGTMAWDDYYQVPAEELLPSTMAWDDDVWSLIITTP